MFQRPGSSPIHGLPEPRKMQLLKLSDLWEQVELEIRAAREPLEVTTWRYLQSQIAMLGLLVETKGRTERR